MGKVPKQGESPIKRHVSVANLLSMFLSLGASGPIGSLKREDSREGSIDKLRILDKEVDPSFPALEEGQALLVVSNKR